MELRFVVAGKADRNNSTAYYCCTNYGSANYGSADYGSADNGSRKYK